MLQLTVAIVLVTVTFGLIGWLMIRSLKWARNREGHGQVALGHALQELDRLVARPSIENRVNTEAEVKAVNDEHGGE